MVLASVGHQSHNQALCHEIEGKKIAVHHVQLVDSILTPVSTPLITEMWAMNAYGLGAQKFVENGSV